MTAIFDDAIAAWRECREEYELLLWAAYADAEKATSARLLNARGERAGVDPVSLFMGNRVRAYAYASEELVEHWQRRPRVTFADFEQQWIRGRDGR